MGKEAAARQVFFTPELVRTDLYGKPLVGRQAAHFIQKYAEQWGEDLATEVYAASLIGADQKLVLHGGGNCSVKTACVNRLGERIEAIYVKASGVNLASIEPRDYTSLDLAYLRKLRALPELSDEDMVSEFRTHSLSACAADPSIETLVHVFVPAKFVDHTHPDAILALSNQENGEKLLKEALGEDVAILKYSSPGFRLAKAVADYFDRNPAATAMVLMHHGLLTWERRRATPTHPRSILSPAQKATLSSMRAIRCVAQCRLRCRSPKKGSPGQRRCCADCWQPPRPILTIRGTGFS